MENKLDGIIEAVHEKKLPPELLDVVIDFLDYLTWQNVREIRKLKERIKKHQINQNNGIIQKLNGKIKNMRSK